MEFKSTCAILGQCRYFPIGILDSVGRQISYPMSLGTTAILLQQNIAVAATDSVAIPLKEVTSIALNGFLTGTNLSSSDDILMLRKIASLCPYTYGIRRL